MEERHIESLREKIPDFDYHDVTEKTNRQLAPEIASDIFTIMREKEQAVGDYITDSRFGITRAYRESMVSFLRTLHRHKKYRPETFYLA